VDVARKISTVWRTVATLNSQFSILRSHPLPSGGRCEENLHRLANGGYLRTVATFERWLPSNAATMVTVAKNVFSFVQINEHLPSIATQPHDDFTKLAIT
jgi:hypothetical protein